ncbi:MAG: glycoside hydrolase family 26 [Bacteroidetes bacterium]|nr:glycoside hydrolase family 26 [Bacteroidota bacterium]
MDHDEKLRKKFNRLSPGPAAFSAILAGNNIVVFQAKKRMGRTVFFILFLLLHGMCAAQTSRLKSVIYDFDGLDIGATDLPDGDYRNGDMSYQVAATPLVNSDVLGDRALQLNLNWSGGTGEFGKAVSRFIDLNRTSDRLNFYFYNALANSADSLLEVVITEDDNSNNLYEYAADDKWVDTIVIHRQAGWQLISLPLSAFTDGNPGGNGIFDAGYAGTGSMLFSVSFVFIHTSAASSTAQYFIDMICFSEGALPTGAGILDLPPKAAYDHCLLGALANNDYPDTTPDTMNALLPNRMTYVNWFMDYSRTGTIANNYPGSEVTRLLEDGYTPIITWEMMYESYPRLDPVQPRLNKILDGSFDAYIDAFADQVKTYGNTVIIRIFHEFEGNWYCWSLTENYSDPAIYISAWRHVVDRFRARGANNVQWMWCVNAEPRPYVDYNWIISAYPGDSYVDIVATDVYNHPDLGVPAWKSFRYTLAESYYYLTTYFPGKPFYICEVASRERYPGEPVTSQSKGEWICQMSRDLQSYFSKTRALVFFSTVKEHDWRVNSSGEALAAVRSCIWDNGYFGKPAGTPGSNGEEISFSVYPNPFSREISIGLESFPVSTAEYAVTIYDLFGKKVFEWKGTGLHESIQAGAGFAAGIYIVELKTAGFTKRIKVVKAREEG